MEEPKLLYFVALLLASAIGLVQAQTRLTIDGVDRCLSDGLDWYINTVGETPCKTYQRLRQICNPVYKVQPFFSTTPGDTCNEQLSRCCCNSIAFSLSMLCMNCQAGAGLPTLTNGIDAGVGAYPLYRGTCGGGVTQKLPEDVQLGVCTKQIDIRSTLYGLYWVDGAWFYAYTSQAFTLDANKQPQANLTNCPNTSSSSVSTTATSTQAISGTITPALTSTSATSKPSNTGAIAGGVGGGVAALIAIAVFVWWFLRRRSRKGAVDLLGGGRASREMAPVSPFMVTAPSSYPNGEASAGGLTFQQGGRIKSGMTSASAPSFPQPQIGGPYSHGSSSQTGESHTYASTTTGSEADGLTMQASPFVARTPRQEKSLAPRSRGAQSISTSPGRISEDRNTAIPERHEDAGISLARSGSGRLPPAYPAA